MNSSELHEAFRTDIRITSPAILSDDEVWRYANDAYRNFVRLTGGVPDFTSRASAITLNANVATSPISKLILNIVKATRRSDGGNVTVVNTTDIGSIPRIKLDATVGPVDYVMVGASPHLVRWIQVPSVADTVDLLMYRLPLDIITEDGQELPDVDERHHLHLLNWMKHLAHLKSDPVLYSPSKSEECGKAFIAYCAAAKAELDRYKRKPRSVMYGGL